MYFSETIKQAVLTAYNRDGSVVQSTELHAVTWQRVLGSATDMAGLAGVVRIAIDFQIGRK